MPPRTNGAHSRIMAAIFPVASYTAQGIGWRELYHRNHGNRLLRKLVITLVASLAAGGGLWLTLRPHHPSQEEIADRLKAQAEVAHSVKCGHDYVPGTSAYVQCMLQLNAARTAQLEPRGALDIKGRNAVTGTFARVGAAIIMLVTFVVMMLLFLGFWSLGVRLQHL